MLAGGVGRGRSGRSGLNEGCRRTGAVSWTFRPPTVASEASGAAGAAGAEALATGAGSEGFSGAEAAATGAGDGSDLGAAAMGAGAEATTDSVTGAGATGLGATTGADDSTESPSVFFLGAAFLDLDSADSPSPSIFFLGAAFLGLDLPDFARSDSKAGLIWSTHSPSIGDRTDRTSWPASFRSLRTVSFAISNSVATSVIRVLLTEPRSR